MAFPAARYTLLELTAESTGDFQLEAEEVAKGAHVFESYIDSIHIPERQKAASQALNALALVMTDGKRTGAEFPWHQLQAHHGKAALSALREAGIPARVESYLCQRDSDRKLQRQPESYTSRQVRQIREVLRRVLRECSTLGYAETERVTEILRPGGNKTARGRTLTISEFRALVSVCEKEATPTSARDNLLIRLGFEAGLRLSEITAVQIEDLKWNDRAGDVRIRIRGPKGQRGRSVSLSNAALVVVEEWLEARGHEDGPLLCLIGRAQKVEIKRLKGADIRLACNRRAELAGVELFSPQDLRRSVAEGIVETRPTRERVTLQSLFDDEPQSAPEARLAFSSEG